MADLPVSKSFRNQPVKIGVGPFDTDGNQKQLSVSDISYGKHKDFMQVITNIWMRMQTMPKTTALFEQMVQIKVGQGVSVNEAVNSICTDVAAIYKNMTGDEKKELLKLLTDNQLTDTEIDELQTTELHDLLLWLIERNLRAEKNFEASLISILIPKSQANT